MVLYFVKKKKKKKKKIFFTWLVCPQSTVQIVMVPGKDWAIVSAFNVEGLV